MRQKWPKNDINNLKWPKKGINDLKWDKSDINDLKCLNPSETKDQRTSHPIHS